MRLSMPLLVMLAVLLPLASIVAQDVEPRPFTAEDVHRVVEVRELAVAPEGDWVAYTLRSTDTGKDRTSSDLFMVSWDGSTRIQLTQSDGSESRPRFSPDGKYLAFLTARGGDDSGSSKDPAAKSQGLAAEPLGWGSPKADGARRWRVQLRVVRRQHAARAGVEGSEGRGRRRG